MSRAKAQAAVLLDRELRRVHKDVKRALKPALAPTEADLELLRERFTRTDELARTIQTLREQALQTGTAGEEPGPSA